jgi:integrase
MRRARRRSLGLPEDDEAHLKTLAVALGKKPADEVAEWILHDLRRTAATGMARLNIPPHVVDKVLNHVSGTIRGVAAVYNRFGYVEERKAALEAWGRYVADLVRPAGNNVIEMRSKA